MTASLNRIDVEDGMRVAANVAAEDGLIGATLCQPGLIDRVADIVRGADFSDPFRGHVFDLIVREHSLGRILNPLTIHPFLDSDGAFALLGGQAWLCELTSQPVIALAAVGNAQQVAEFARRRELIHACREGIRRASDVDVPVDQAVRAVEEGFDRVQLDRESEFELSAGSALAALIDNLDEPLDGVLSGQIPSIDSLLGPLRRSHLIIGAGRPGMGKTATAISYALGAARRGHGVLFLSLEMSATELAERMAGDLCLDSRVPYRGVCDRKLTNEQVAALCRARSRLDEMPLQIVDRPGITISQLRTMARRWKRRFSARGQRLELIIVDYLQLIGGDRRQERYELVSEASRALKATAKENQLAVLALSQLNRSVDGRGDKRPLLSDLRESGQIEQDADAVLFFLRDEYYLRAAEPYPGDPDRAEWERKLRACQGRIEFICAKRRNGPTGSAIGHFHAEFQAVRG